MRKASVLQAAFSASLTAIVELQFEEVGEAVPVRLPLHARPGRRARQSGG